MFNNTQATYPNVQTILPTWLQPLFSPFANESTQCIKVTNNSIRPQWNETAHRLMILYNNSSLWTDTNFPEHSIKSWEKKKIDY